MGKRSNFDRREADFYPTPRAAVVPLIVPVKSNRSMPCLQVPTGYPTDPALIEQDPDQGTLVDVPDPAVRRSTRHSPVMTNSVNIGFSPQ